MNQQAVAEAPLDGPIVIAHRGASGYRPEHTLMGYKLALEMGADYIEPDLVMTKDGHLVVRHDIYLSDSTNVAEVPAFASRKRTFEGRTDWFVFDFTLAELRTLKTRQPRPARGTDYDGIEPVPTFDEVIDFILKAHKEGYKAGLYIEMKSPQMFTGRGLDPTKALTAGFKRLSDAGIPLYFQCFDSAFLMHMKDRIKAPLIWLIEGHEDEKTGAYVLDAPLDVMAGKIDGVGPYKRLLLDARGKPNDFVKRAHKLGLLVHIWTIRDDDVGAGFASSRQELKLFYSMGVDGVFTDFADTAIDVRNSMKLLKPEVAE
ncbi:glycerophosphodiester phosphodiesterase family protein [Kordiimonas marina]|uniref:glycerophosphodiester phosphodiesterase family protein n=1 Tax=Kordiimonas marina TaxID=2872312 RepID=UPI001FF483D4|nr:glycerophosphodiester phosphodiesterase family protein [Kordiimonas marina]MCJ9428984.1 hypothetical protein [Kordiimonas marina]